MERLEFYIYEQELWCKHPDGKNELIGENSTELIGYILEKVQNCYPEAYNALEKFYSKSSANIRYYKYLMARRFIKCNFSRLDSTTLDVGNGVFNFEKVECPMRGECQFEGVICSPKFNSRLSPAELRVMEPFFNGRTKEEIAEALFISPGVVKLHIKNAYAKLGVHEKAEFIRYAQENNLFGN